MPYYDYKGAEWMNQKKIELLDAIKTNTPAEWKNLTPNGTNSNVHDYYFYMGQVPSTYGVYVDQFFADSILIHVSGDFRNLYYNEKNVTSVFFDPTSDSVIFETGSNAKLEIKAPKIYKTGPNLFILENGEEIAPETTTDDCFYYVTIQTKIPEKIEIAYAFWPEYPETITQCETINVSPLKQVKYGIPNYKIQCRDNLQLILKTSNNSPTCVKPETKTKLLERGWGEHAPIPEPEIIKETNFDSEKYYEEFDSGSPLMYLDTSNPVLDNDNCERYAYWLTKHQKEKLDKYEDYPRYPPWGNQIFPLVDYCIKNGDLIKTIVNDKIQWSFSGNSEPEFKDEKITIIKISKGEIMSEKAIKFNGWTNQPNQEIVLTVTAPNGNVISTGKLSPMNNGTFVDAITTGGPLWEQQDGIYLVTVQQGNDPMNSAYFELELKDGNIITGK